MLLAAHCREGRACSATMSWQQTSPTYTTPTTPPPPPSFSHSKEAAQPLSTGWNRNPCQATPAREADLQREHVLAAVIPDLEDTGLQPLHWALVDAALLHLELNQQGDLQWKADAIPDFGHMKQQPGML